MKSARAGLAVALAICAGCAFMPRDYARLDEARRAYAEAVRDPTVAGFAPTELQAAAEVLERAAKARDTLDDPAIVDHLSYLARQRVAIAREAARMRSFDRTGRAL
jgi:Domain of unknown function (DUF4398)